LRTISQLSDAITADEPELVSYVAGRDGPSGAGMGVICVNPARRLEPIHRQALGTVAMSATLTPLAYYAEVLGFGRLDPVTTSVPSPFPTEHRRVVAVPTVSTTLRERDRYCSDMARLISETVAVRPGRYVAFFSSFGFLSQVLAKLDIPPDQLLVQLPQMSEVLRLRTLNELRSSSTPKLLLAVMGGVFAEGVDLPGDSLIGAIVVGPGLPSVGFERALIRNYFDEQDGCGFEYAMLYPGMQRVIQSAGRVIRSMDDKGIIVLLGRRFAERRYAECFPDDWYQYDATELVTNEPVGELERFWTEMGHPTKTPAPCQPRG
jgi:DNA excision repair protein ERCC-2